MVKFLSLIAIAIFFYLLIKQKLRNRKLRAQGIVVEEKGLRPITLMSIVMVVMYGGYLIYFLFSSNGS